MLRRRDEEHHALPSLRVRHLQGVKLRPGGLGVLLFPGRPGHQPGGERRPLQRRRQQGEGQQLDRSKEHTSELQQLMRLSYAVSVSKKKIKSRSMHTSQKYHMTTKK